MEFWARLGVFNILLINIILEVTHMNFLQRARQAVGRTARRAGNAVRGTFARARNRVMGIRSLPGRVGRRGVGGVGSAG
nr:MAG TPA: hypothetical protein [Caudoviricetes sp.]